MKLSEILDDRARKAYYEWTSYGNHKYWWGLYKHPQKEEREAGE